MVFQFKSAIQGILVVNGLDAGQFGLCPGTDHGVESDLAGMVMIFWQKPVYQIQVFGGRIAAS